jgi:hypothetical protein
VSQDTDRATTGDRRSALTSCLVVPPVILAFVVARHYQPSVDWDDEVMSSAASYTGLFVALAVAVACLLALAVWSRAGTSPRRPYLVAPVVTLLLLAWVGFFGLWVFTWRPPWMAPESTLGPDGARYRLGGRQDDSYLLRDLNTDGEVWTAEIVAGSAADSDECARVVRPAGSRAWGVVVAPDETMLVLTEEGWAAVAWNPHLRRPIRPDHGPPMVQRALRPEEIAPFVLLDADDIGDEADLAAVITAIEERLEHEYRWAPGERALLEALDSPNAWVRDGARRLVRAGGATLYPEATKRL